MPVPTPRELSRMSDQELEATLRGLSDDELAELERGGLGLVELPGGTMVLHCGLHPAVTAERWRRGAERSPKR